MATTLEQRLIESIESTGVVVEAIDLNSTTRKLTSITLAGTNAQKIAANTVINNFDFSLAADLNWLQSKYPDIQALVDAADQAVIDINTYLTIADTATAAQVRTEVKAIDQRAKQIIRALKVLANQIITT